MGDDGDGEVSPAERAHQRRRDRKRETRMVVDNAGIRRLLPVLHRRSQPDRKSRQDRTPEPPPGSD